MPKKVVVQNGLENIKKGLEKLGYEVVKIDESDRVDAIIYIANGYDTSFYNLMNVNNDKNRNILLINASGKTINQIDNMIKNRLYSPLFE